MKKEFTYSVPESFLKDAAVPIRWRVWAVINGFFIAGKEFWGSNEWIGEQIGCHKDSVSQGVKELEALGMVHSKRTRRTRVMYPGKGEIGATTYLRQALPPISDRRERLSISDSNSVNELVVAEPPTVDIPIGKEERPTKTSKSKYPHSKEVFSWFPNPQKSWEFNTTELKHAELLFDRGEAEVKKRLRFLKEHEGEDFLPSITKPSDLERKWEDIKAYAKRNR